MAKTVGLIFPIEPVKKSKPAEGKKEAAEKAPAEKVPADEGKKGEE